MKLRIVIPKKSSGYFDVIQEDGHSFCTCFNPDDGSGVLEKMIQFVNLSNSIEEGIDPQIQILRLTLDLRKSECRIEALQARIDKLEKNENQ
jgi:hypothetical protein